MSDVSQLSDEDVGRVAQVVVGLLFSSLKKDGVGVLQAVPDEARKRTGKK